MSSRGMGAAPAAVLVVSPVGKVDRRLGADALYPLHVGNTGQHAREGYEYRGTSRSNYCCWPYGTNAQSDQRLPDSSALFSAGSLRTTVCLKFQSSNKGALGSWVTSVRLFRRSRLNPHTHHTCAPTNPSSVASSDRAVACEPPRSDMREKRLPRQLPPYTRVDHADDCLAVNVDLLQAEAHRTARHALKPLRSLGHVERHPRRAPAA
jgi:hypothetical protein